MLDYNILELARKLMIYGAFAPHCDLEMSPEYPKITHEEFVSRLNEPHSGDCTSCPWRCMRCEAEEYVHQATWLMNNCDIKFKKLNP